MATDLTIPLSDTEQAEFIAVGQTLYPTASNPELKVWATWVAKDGLRTALARIKLEILREQENAARQVEKQDFEADWPEESNPLEA